MKEPTPLPTREGVGDADDARADSQPIRRKEFPMGTLIRIIIDLVLNEVLKKK